MIRNDIINLEKLYREASKDVGKNPPKECIENTFLHILKEKGKQFLKAK